MLAFQHNNDMLTNAGISLISDHFNKTMDMKAFQQNNGYESISTITMI